MAEVSAAMSTRKKNRLAKNIPPAGRARNTFGRVLNSSPSSMAGSSPKANTAGKMAKPAIRAITVSRPATMRAERSRLCCTMACAC